MAVTVRLYDADMTEVNPTVQVTAAEMTYDQSVAPPDAKVRVYGAEMSWAPTAPVVRVFGADMSTDNLTATVRLYGLEISFDGTTPNPLRTGAYRLTELGQWADVGFTPL